MGLFNPLGWLKTKRAEHAARQATAKFVEGVMMEMQKDEEDAWQKVVERNLMGSRRSAGDVQEDGTTIVNTRSEGSGWEILGSAWKGHIARDQQIMVAQARRFFRFDPNAQAAIYGLLDYMMGRGVTITPKSKDPRIWKLWRQFWTSPDNNMQIRQFEIFKRLFRDGEVFLRYFSKTKEGQATWQSIVRFMDPIDVRRGATEKDGGLTDKTNQGIVFDPNDAEKPLEYYMQDRNNPGKEHVIKADEVQHVKYPVADMDQSRGESAIQSVMELFTHYKQWLKNRIILNKLRTAIFAVRKIDIQSGASVNQLSQSLPTSGRSVDGETKKKNIKPGTLYTPPPGVDIEMKSANINASDVKEDGRNMILQMAAGTRLPEFMFGDASNANYSSTMMAESPFVKHIHFLQSYCEATVWQPMFRRVIEAAVKAGKLSAPAEEDIFSVNGKSEKKLNEATDKEGEEPIEDTPDAKANKDKKKPDAQRVGEVLSESESEIFYGCDVEWPEIIHREPKEQTEALILARDAGWLSDKTAAEKLGFEYAEEVRKQLQVEEEAELLGNPLLNRSAQGLAFDDEEQQGKDQEDEELAAAGKGKEKGKPFRKSNGGEPE